MDDFTDALISTKINSLIPAQKDYFGTLIGEWDFDWEDRILHKSVKGEWLFSRVLDGTAVQDLFICPSRRERAERQGMDNEYGTTIRTYNPSTGNWEIYYCCYGESTRLEAIKEGDNIVLIEREQGKMKWIFSDITQNSFHWQHIKMIDGKWVLCRDCHAIRRK